MDLSKSIIIGKKSFVYCPLSAVVEQGWGDPEHLPFSLRVLLENLLRQLNQGDQSVIAQIKSLLDDSGQRQTNQAINFKPARVLMQDFTGVPAVVDLAAMRDGVSAQGGDPKTINPVTPVDLVVDHSVSVDFFGSKQAYQKNIALEVERNKERYHLLRWAQGAFDNFRVIPPGTGICHQVNLEYLAQVVWQQKNDKDLNFLFPDTLVGTDSHTTMINALGVLGWGVGGIEAEAVMLGQSISMNIPQVVGVKLLGELNSGVTATDLVLTIVELLRKKGVVGKFVEFYGPGLDHLSVSDRATIANMAPEYGATCGFFPIDQKTIEYLQLTNRSSETIDYVEQYAKLQNLWRNTEQQEKIKFDDDLILDLYSIQPSVAGPKRPQDRVVLGDLKKTSKQLLSQVEIEVDQTDLRPHPGDLVIAAITSCTNTSNPSVMLAAGLVAQKAVARGLKVKPWVKTSLAPGSKVVSRYLEQSGLQSALDQLGFNLVGYGCTTCIGNSGPLPLEIAQHIENKNINVSAVLSGNRNFEGRIHPLVKSNWLASPPLVVAFALAGTTLIDLQQEPLAVDQDGQSVYLKDLWPSPDELEQYLQKVSAKLYQSEYKNVFEGSEDWQSIQVEKSTTFAWDQNSSYIRQVPFFDQSPQDNKIQDLKNARILALLGDSVTTDHISPAGSIAENSPAGQYLKQEGVAVSDFNSYGSRRGNHQVMMRGTFANIRIRNLILPETQGSYTLHQPSGERMSIYDAAMRYQAENCPLVIIAGKEYGTGSSRDWAAKGTKLLGVRAVIAESFERIHRSNLIGMGVLPLQLSDQIKQSDLALAGSEIIEIIGIDDLSVAKTVSLNIYKNQEETQALHYDLICRIDTQEELEYFKNGGILQTVLQNML